MAVSHDVRNRLNEHLRREPSVAGTAFVAPNASIIGAVTIGEYSSIWYQAVIRADIHFIQIGNRTNIQDGAILHVADQFPLTIGHEVTCGHRAVVHACSVGDRVLIGIGAIVLDGVEIGADCIIGAQALLTKGSKIPPGSLVIGAPAKVARSLTEAEKASIGYLAAKYVDVAAFYRNWLNQQKAEQSSG